MSGITFLLSAGLYTDTIAVSVVGAMDFVGAVLVVVHAALVVGSILCPVWLLVLYLFSLGVREMAVVVSVVCGKSVVDAMVGVMSGLEGRAHNATFLSPRAAVLPS